MLFLSCDTNLLPFIKLVKNGIFPIIQIGIPILLIIMGSIDLGKAVLASDDKEIKAATSRLIKRAIAAAAVFFVVTIVSLLMNTIGGTNTGNQSGTTSWQECWDQA